MRAVFILSCLVASTLTQGASEEASSGVSTASPINELDEVASTAVIMSGLTSSHGGADDSGGSTPRQKKCRKRPRTKPKAPSCRKPNKPKTPPSGTICFSVKDMMQDTITSASVTLSPSLINLGTGDQTEKIDLTTLRDQLEPLVTSLQTQIQAIRSAPKGSDKSGVLDQILIVLEDILKNLLPDEPIDVGTLASKLLESVLLLIGYTVIDAQGGDGLSPLLSNILSSIVLPILNLLGTLGVSTAGLLETLSDSVNSLINSGAGGLLGGGREPSLPVSKKPGSDSGSDDSGLIGGLLSSVLG